MEKVKKILLFIGAVAHGGIIFSVAVYLGFILIPQMFVGVDVYHATPEQHRAMINTSFLIYIVALLPHVWGVYTVKGRTPEFYWGILAIACVLIPTWVGAWNIPAVVIGLVLVGIAGGIVNWSITSQQQRSPA